MTETPHQEQRTNNIERALRFGLPEPVAHLFGTVQEPRADGEVSSPAFDAVLRQEVSRLRSCANGQAPTGGMLFDSGGLGGLLETEAHTSAQRLIAAAHTAGMVRTAGLLREALDECRGLPRQGASNPASVPLPAAERVIDPQTGRPIGMWR